MNPFGRKRWIIDETDEGSLDWAWNVALPIQV
jgi:hypothetical protein